MRTGVAALLAVVAAVLPQSEATAQRSAPLTIAQPQGAPWGPVVVAIVDHRRALPTGGYFCPDDEGPDAVCLGATIVEAPVRRVTMLSAPPPGWRTVPPRPRVRFLARHAVRHVAAGRQLMVLEQTENGYFWGVWTSPVRGGWACFDNDVMTRLSLSTTSARRFRSHGGQENCLRISDLR